MVEGRPLYVKDTLEFQGELLPEAPKDGLTQA